MSPACKTLLLVVVLGLTFALVGRWVDQIGANNGQPNLSLCPFCHQEVAQ